MNNFSKSVELIRLISHALGELNEFTVFVGGTTVPFYIPKVYWPQARATDDVDIIMEIVERKENWKLTNLLQEKGFENDMSEGAPVCRWVYKGIKVDIMSTEGHVFGFTNKWYKEGIRKTIQLSSPFPNVKILSFPYFIATKLEAFKGRGKEDYQGSRDMEDIISLLEVFNQEDIKNSIRTSSKELRKYLVERLEELKSNNDFLDAIPGSVFNRSNALESKRVVLSRLELIMSLSQAE